MNASIDLSASVALVTGASRGLGRALAQRLGAAGAHVIATARTVGGLEELDDAVRAAGGPAPTLVPLDLTAEDGLERLGAAIHDRWGRLDLLVHAAAHAAPLSPAEHLDPKVWARCMEVNARGTQRLIACAEPLLRAAPAPRAAFFADQVNRGPFHAAYAASKAAAEVVVAAWAQESARKPLTVLSLTPPAMATALRARFHPGEPRDPLATPEAAAEALWPELIG
ncbi:MAG: SDR family NAD(P)-dependent oxidoreductase [Pseudomonadota bacterium]